MTDDRSEGVDEPEPASETRDVVVPLRVYKTVTVFSTLFAVAAVVGGFLLIDQATDRATLPTAEIDPVVAIAGIALIVVGGGPTRSRRAFALRKWESLKTTPTNPQIMADEFAKGFGILVVAGLGWMTLAGWYRTPSFEGQQLQRPGPRGRHGVRPDRDHSRTRPVLVRHPRGVDVLDPHPRV